MPTVATAWRNAATSETATRKQRRKAGAVEVRRYGRVARVPLDLTVYGLRQPVSDRGVTTRFVQNCTLSRSIPAYSLRSPSLRKSLPMRLSSVDKPRLWTTRPPHQAARERAGRRAWGQQGREGDWPATVERTEDMRPYPSRARGSCRPPDTFLVAAGVELAADGYPGLRPGAGDTRLHMGSFRDSGASGGRGQGAAADG